MIPLTLPLNLTSIIPISEKLGNLQPLVALSLEKQTKKRIRYAAVSVPEVLERVIKSGNTVGTYENWTFINGIQARVTPARLRAFQQSTTCACCGIEGNVFLLERHINEPAGQYINLYSVSKKGRLTLMTADHILPDSLGGRYSPQNFQTMCSPCNQAKQNMMPVLDIEKVLANTGQYAKHWVDTRLLAALLQAQVMYHKTSGKQRREFLVLFEKYRFNIKVAKPKPQIERALRNLNFDLAVLTYKIGRHPNWFGIAYVTMQYWITSVVPQKRIA